MHHHAHSHQDTPELGLNVQYPSRAWLLLGASHLYQKDGVALRTLNVERGKEELQWCREIRVLQLKV
jgi:hypothetical protein